MKRKSFDAPGGARHWIVNGRFLTQQITGVQRYSREIVAGLDDILTNDKDLARRLTLKIVAPQVASELPLLQSITCQQSKSLSGHLWDQLVLPRYQKDGMLSLANFGPLAIRSHIVCIHDANTFIAPESYSRVFGLVYRTLLPMIGRRARRIATVSSFSARMLAQFNVCSPDRIFIAPNGHEHVLRWNPERAFLPVLETVKRPFVLLLGSRAKHKNIGIVLNSARAFDAAGLDIVVVGSASGIFADQAESIAALNVYYTGYVGDDELGALYSRALCLCFPSKTEGFGVPPLEAMASGCPVVSSTAASLTEVGGDAVLYADPNDSKAWIESVIALSINPGLRAATIEKGRKQSKLFSWKRSAQIYLEEILNPSIP